MNPTQHAVANLIGKWENHATQYAQFAIDYRMKEAPEFLAAWHETTSQTYRICAQQLRDALAET